MSAISDNAKFAGKFDSSSKEVSIFLSCNSKDFAKTWNSTFKVYAAGAEGKIDFSAIDKPSHTKDVIVRLQNTAKNWFVYH